MRRGRITAPLTSPMYIRWMSSNDHAPVPLADLLDLTGSVAIITGGARGIGLGIARRLHEAGASVVLADPLPEAGDAAAALESTRTGSAMATKTDVSDEAQVEQLMQTTTDRFGHIDILVNNAAVFPMNPIVDMNVSNLRRVLDVNLIGPFLCTRAAGSRMIERGTGGSIINILSYALSRPTVIGLAPYDASKHGGLGLTRSAALEFAPHHIRVNALAPGAVLTEGATSGFDDEAINQVAQAIPMGHFAQPDDIARAALFLASPLSSYMTGSVMLVDGGLTLG